MGTHRQTNKRTNIYSIFWYKLSLQGARIETSLHDDPCDHPCENGDGYQMHVEAFCESAKVNIAKTRETNYNDIVSSTLSLLTVIFEDFGSAVDSVEIYSKDVNTIQHASDTVLLNRYYEFGKMDWYLLMISRHYKRNV